MHSFSAGGLAILLLAPLMIHAAPNKAIPADQDYLGCVNALFSVNSNDKAKASIVMAFPRITKRRLWRRLRVKMESRWS